MIKHAFVVCAYKESEYLEECVKSLVEQTVRSPIAIATSTPNDYISSIADKYSLMFVTVKVIFRMTGTLLLSNWNPNG